MSHWAEVKEIDGKLIVQRVLVGDNNDKNGDEGYKWLIDNLGGRWVQTSFNANFRKNFAGEGFEYREDIDAFVAPQPFPSWTLNEETAQWEAPVPRPEGFFNWDEEQGAWIEKPVLETPQA